VIVSVALIQFYGQSKINSQCSYLDPILVDFLAFGAALFLFLEGIYRIFENPNYSLKKQITVIIRIAFGCAIITLHIIQFIHK